LAIRPPGVLSREIDLTPLWRTLRTLREHPAEVLLALGMFLRVWVYLLDRYYWMDEGSLLGNLVGRPIFDFSSPLAGDQLAPIGFLVIERVVVALLGDSGYATRLVPLICGLASLWLFAKLAARVLSPPAALVALALFALSDDLVYYSSELKQYSSDLAIALAVTLASVRLLGHPLGRRDAAILAAMAIAAPWFSFPSAFVVAGCGAALVLDRIRRGWWRDVGLLAVVGAGWAISFVLSYRASHALLGPATTMYVFWNFAFLPLPPRTTADLAQAGGVLLEVFVNPLNLVPPGLPPWVVVVPIAILLVGGWSMAARDRPVFLVLTLPALLALFAAATKRFPFHGRLILELMPAFFLMIAEAAGLLRSRVGRRAYAVILVLLLFYPCMSTLYEATGRRERWFNAHGDLHKNRFME
jgi:hypothetical protein